MLRNSPLALALLFAIARARAVWVPINVQSRGENLGYIFDHSAPKLIIADAALTATIEASGANLSGVQVFTTDAVQAVADERRRRVMERGRARGRRHLRRDVHVRHDRPPEGRAGLAPDAAARRTGGWRVWRRSACSGRWRRRWRRSSPSGRWCWSSTISSGAITRRWG